jgi:hypothetical protein
VNVDDDRLEALDKFLNAVDADAQQIPAPHGSTAAWAELSEAWSDLCALPEERGYQAAVRLAACAERFAYLCKDRPQHVERMG